MLARRSETWPRCLVIQKQSYRFEVLPLLWRQAKDAIKAAIYAIVADALFPHTYQPPDHTP